MSKKKQTIFHTNLYTGLPGLIHDELIAVMVHPEDTVICSASGELLGFIIEDTKNTAPPTVYWSESFPGELQLLLKHSSLQSFLQQAKIISTEAPDTVFSYPFVTKPKKLRPR